MLRILIIFLSLGPWCPCVPKYSKRKYILFCSRSVYMTKKVDSCDLSLKCKFSVDSVLNNVPLKEVSNLKIKHAINLNFSLWTQRSHKPQSNLAFHSFHRKHTALENSPQNRKSAGVLLYAANTAYTALLNADTLVFLIMVIYFFTGRGSKGVCFACSILEETMPHYILHINTSQ